MWSVIKFEKKNFNYFKNEINNKFGSNFQIYCPKIIVENFKNNKLIKKEINLLGDYVFCFYKEFSKKDILNQIKYLKGVKYLLDGYLKSQDEIENFVKSCKNMENEKGHITQTSFETKINHYYKFSTGPFTQQIFKIISMQKNKLKILMGNCKTIVDKRDYLLSPL
jgi:hypothetical protein|tara:strand:- start:1055 stop:1552 length:498 start_codon:yes stop_codon:yes gene_type:complete